MRHYDYPDEEADRVTREGVRLAMYFACPFGKGA